MNSKKYSPIIAQEKRQGCHGEIIQPIASASYNPMQESEGTAKSGNVNVLFHTTKTKKMFYGVLCERSLELHESEKSQKRKKNAKHVIDISNCFNLAQMTFPKHKLCMSVMTPDETFLIRGESDRDTAEWYKCTLSAMIPARALYLGRPVFDNEFFECAWDVCISSSPKLKKPVTNSESSPNICLKKPELARSQYRLCFYPHTIILCPKGVEPVSTSSLPKSGLPPFKTSDFVEFSRQYLCSYGSQEKYFIMRIGRSAPTGLCEVWMQCESDETAVDVRNKLTDIIERETEKRKGFIALGSLPNAIPFNKSKHRAKSPQFIGNKLVEEQNSEPSTINSCVGLTTIVEKPSVGDSLDRTHTKKNLMTSTLSQSVKEKRLVLRDYKAKVDSLEREFFYEKQIAKSQIQKGNLSVDQAIAADINRCRMNSSIRMRVSGSHSANNICAAPMVHDQEARRTSCSNSKKKLDDQVILNKTDRFTTSNSITPPLNELCSNGESVISSAAEEETEDSGGTLRFTYDSNSRSASILNLPLAANQQQQRFMVEALVEYHGTAHGGNNGEATDNSFIVRKRSQDTLSNQFFNNSPNTEDSCSAADAGAEDSSLSLSDLNTHINDSTARKRLSNSVARRRANEISAIDSENASTSSSISNGGQLIDCERQSGRSVPSQDEEYTSMDKASCSSNNSGSASHLIVSQKFENQVTSPEEFCSYASDSGDSCYSSMVNGHVNSRAFSFSSEMPRPTRLQNSFPSDVVHYQQLRNSNSIRDKHCHLPLNTKSAFSEDKLNSRHSVMGTPLLENGEMKDDYLNNKRLTNTIGAQSRLLILPDEESRKRTFSLGSSSTSWFAKGFRKLSFNSNNRLRNSPSKSGSSLSNSVTAESEDSIKQSYGCLSSRQPSTCSFASSRHTRSDSIDSSHSNSFVNSPITPTISQRMFSGNSLRHKFSEKVPTGDHLIELDFAPNSTSILSNSSSSTKVGNPSGLGTRKSNGKLPITASHNSMDGVSPTFSNNSLKFAAEDGKPWTQDKRLKPSEAFIRTLSQNEGSKARRRGKQGEYQGLEEVQCFISQADTEKMMILSSTDSKETTSLHSTHSHKTDSGQFETIEEHASGKSSNTSSRNSLNQSPKILKKLAKDEEYVLMPNRQHKMEGNAAVAI